MRQLSTSFVVWTQEFESQILLLIFNFVGKKNSKPSKSDVESQTFYSSIILAALRASL